MARRSYSRADVETHSDGFRPGRPAVNVKVYGSTWQVPLPLDLGSSRPSDSDPDDPASWTYHRTDPRFTHEWVEAHVSPDSADAIFWQCCAAGFEMLQEDARELFGSGVSVYSEGRSGGWAVVDGLALLEEWDAIALGRWRRFELYAKAYASDIPRQMLDSFYVNEFEVWSDALEDSSVANSEVPLDQFGMLPEEVVCDRY